MIRGFKIVLLIAAAVTGSIVALLRHGSNHPSQRMADVEYQVYSAAIPHFMNGVRMRNGWMVVEPYHVELVIEGRSRPRYPRSEYLSPLEEVLASADVEPLCDVPLIAELSFAIKNLSSVPLARRFDLGEPYSLLSKTEISERRRNEWTWTPYLRLSRVGFDSSRRAAVVHLEFVFDFIRGHSESAMILLQREDGNWRIVQFPPARFRGFLTRRPGASRPGSLARAC